MSITHQDLVKHYLRLNGYFVVENFIIHDPNRVYDEHVGNKTENDILALKLKHSKEIAGHLHIANDCQLQQIEKIDLIVAEVKSGKNNRPNGAWRNPDFHAIGYIIRFAGLFDQEEKIETVAEALGRTFKYEDESVRIRYIIFSEAANRPYHEKGVFYIDFRSIVEFLVIIRGQCWLNSDIGVASTHTQWSDSLNLIFQHANDQNITLEERIDAILQQLQI